MVPEGVQSLLCLTGMTTHQDAVASGVPSGVCFVKAGGRMQGLMHVGHQMYEPHEVVGFEIV